MCCFKINNNNKEKQKKNIVITCYNRARRAVPPSAFVLYLAVLGFVRRRKDLALERADFFFSLLGARAKQPTITAPSELKRRRARNLAAP